MAYNGFRVKQALGVSPKKAEASARYQDTGTKGAGKGSEEQGICRNLV